MTPNTPGQKTPKTQDSHIPYHTVPNKALSPLTLEDLQTNCHPRPSLHPSGASRSKSHSPMSCSPKPRAALAKTSRAPRRPPVPDVIPEGRSPKEDRRSRSRRQTFRLIGQLLCLTVVRLESCWRTRSSPCGAMPEPYGASTSGVSPSDLQGVSVHHPSWAWHKLCG